MNETLGHDKTGYQQNNAAGYTQKVCLKIFQQKCFNEKSLKSVYFY